MQYIPLAYQSGADLPVRPWGPGLRTPAAGKNAAASELASLSAQPNATHFACRGWWNFWTIESIIEPGGVNKIAQNLMVLRQLHQLSQEEVAGRIGVSRQAVAKWETGQSVPDILNCDALAKLYDVELDDLLHYDQEQTGKSIPPRGKHLFGTVRVGERGQMVLPKQAREVFGIKPGDRLVVLGDENPEHPGIALMKEGFFLGIARLFQTALDTTVTPDETEGEE